MTSSGAPRLPDYLGHILDAIDRIFRYVDDMDEPAFLVDSKTQDAVIRNFEVIGEAARNIERHAPDFACAHPEVPWGDAYLLRNHVTHGYYKVDLEILWRTVHADLPEMRQQVAELRNSLNDNQQ